MIVRFDTDRLNHIEQLSYYNYNIYELPYAVADCPHLLIEWVDDSSTGEFHLGFITDNNFLIEHSFWGEMGGTVDLINNKLD